ncbi:hypothetical protein E0K89_022130 [Aquicoccus sp. SCR17]|nr:hypothetical protein [Carideicomes alvinocaridis]
MALPFEIGRWSACPVAPDHASLKHLSRLRSEREEMLTRIAVLENDIGKIQCEARAPEARQASRIPTPLPTPGIDRDAFERGDLDAMTGCWQLMTEFETETVRTGETTTYNRWHLCFEPDGGGSEILTATNGTTCEGEVSGSFSAAGLFEMERPGNLRCSDGSYIFKTQASCDLDGQGRAICDLYQPQTGGRDRVEMRRERGSP